MSHPTKDRLLLLDSIMWKVYLLQSTDVGCNKTYVGATLDVERRLEQHNGKQSGGARATKGHQWKRICHITGFPYQRAALQFEWKWKHVSKQEKGSPVERRTRALIRLLNAEQTTSKATDYQEYVGNLEVVWETDIDAINLLS